MCEGKCGIVHCNEQIPEDEVSHFGWGLLRLECSKDYVEIYVCPKHLAMFKSTWLNGTKADGIK